MVFLGLLLILAAIAAMVGVSMNDTGETAPITVLERTFNLTPFELFIAGTATAIVFMIGLGLVSAGMRRTSVRRRRLREERLAERERLTRLESENRDLERRLEDVRTTPTPEDAPRPAPAASARPAAQPADQPGRTGDVAEEPIDRLVARRSREADDHTYEPTADRVSRA